MRLPLALLAPCAALTLFAAAAFNLVVHETAHAFAGRLVSAELRGIETWVLPFLCGKTYFDYPFVESPPHARTVVAAAGILEAGLLGGIAWLAARSTRLSRVLFIPALVAATWGALGLQLLGHACFGPGSGSSDFLATLAPLGLSGAAERWLAGALGACAVGAAGLCWCKGIVGWLGASRRRPFPELAVATAAAIAATGMICGVARSFDPLRAPTSSEIERWVRRHPDDEKVLRRAAYWCGKLGKSEAVCFGYRERAARLSPQSAGALADLARGYRAMGLHEPALQLFERASRLRPDLPAIPAELARLHEDLGQGSEAAAQWRRYARLSQTRWLPAESRRRHYEFAIDRARRLEELVGKP